MILSDNGHNNVLHNGAGENPSLEIVFNGNNNLVSIPYPLELRELKLICEGDGNHIEVGRNNRFGKLMIRCVQGGRVIIGHQTTINHAQLICCAQTHIHIGQDCMLESHILMRTQDAHGIYDLASGQRLNGPGSITIEDHVWIASHVSILSNVTVQSGCIVGAHTRLESQRGPANGEIVGNPAVLRRQNILWERRGFEGNIFAAPMEKLDAFFVHHNPVYTQKQERATTASVELAGKIDPVGVRDTRKKRCLFFRVAPSLFLPPFPFPFQCGVPISSVTHLNDHVGAYGLVGNRGNMIHRYAMTQLLEYDRKNSSQLNLIRLLEYYDHDPEKTAAVINENFDCVILTFSNIIRAGEVNDVGLTALVKALSIPLYCFGIGIQSKAPHTVIDPLVLKFLATLNDKAQLLGVRGLDTLEWCHKHGFTQAVALGCPSMFVYPDKIVAMASSTLRGDNRKVITGGHINQVHKEDPLHTLLQDWDASYVFQGELNSFKEFLSQEGVYDESLSCIDAQRFNEFYREKTGITLPYCRYYEFNDPWSWRQVAAQHQAYVGSRIHGGVAAMQAGIPALVFHKDDRVRELTNFHGIPACSVQELGAFACLEDVFSQYFSPECMGAFRTRYRAVLENFVHELNKVGLHTVYEARLGQLVGGS